MPQVPHPFQAAGQGGRGVASQWRIRHKLLLGLASVVGILTLLLLGTLEGLASYRSSMNTVESKLNELQHAQELQLAVTQLAAPIKPGPLSYERKQLDDKIELAGTAFRAYEKALAERGLTREP